MSRNLALIVALTTACGVGDHGSARQHLGGGDGGIGLPDAPVDAFVPEDTLVEPPDAEVDAFVPEDSGTFGEPDIYLTEPLSGSLEFGDINVGQNSSSQTVAVSNFGTADLSISQVSIFGTGASSFAITSGQVPPPTFVVAPGAQTSWQLRCTPATVGAKSATLRIVSNDPDQPNTDVSLSCNGVQSSLLVTPSPVAFGTHRVGAAPATIEVTLENTGGASLTVNSASMSGAPELSLASAANLPMVLSAGGSTTVTLAFAPTASAAFAATLSVQSSDPSSPTNVAVSGTGEEPMIEVTPADPVEVGAACIGADTDIPFTVASIGSGPFQVTGISATPAELTVDMISSALPATLAGTATLGFRLRIRPTAVGLLSGQVDIATDLPDSPLVVKVTAEGIAGGLAVSPPSIDFGPVVVGADSAARGLGLANCSAGSVTITAVELTGSDAAGFRIETGPQPPPDELLESNQARQWSLVFQPARVGSHVAALTIAMSEGEIVVPLTGSATGGNPDAGSGAGGDNTYYACAVTGRRPWLTLGLVGLALLFASRRRRRPGR